MARISDTELVTHALGGNKGAFGHLAERYYEMAKRFAIRIVKNEDTATDLVQESMLQAYLSLKYLQDGERFKGWLYGIVRNVCMSYIRDRKTHAFSFLPDDILLSYDYSWKEALDPQEIAEKRELYQHMQKAINTLSPGNRTVTRLFYYEQLSLKEVALQLNISVSAVKNRLYKSRRRLMDLLLPVYPEMDRSVFHQLRRGTMVQVTVVDVIQKGHAYWVVLLDGQRHRILAIPALYDEGQAVIKALQRRARRLQITRTTRNARNADYTANILDAAGVELQEVQLETLPIKGRPYCAVTKIYCGGTAQEVVSQPSEAIALALRTDIPIYVNENVLDRASRMIPEDIKQTPQEMYVEEKKLKRLRISKDHQRAIEKLHNHFINLVSSTLSDLVDETVETGICYVDLATYSEVIQCLSSPCCTCTFDMEGLKGKAFLDIPMSLVCCLLGSSDEELGSLTDDQTELILGIIKHIMTDLKMAWAPVLPTKIQDIELKNRPESIGLTSLGEQVIFIVIEVNWGDLSGLISVCYSISMLSDAALLRLSQTGKKPSA